VSINHPARPCEDLRRLQEKGVPLFAVHDDLKARGISSEDCIAGVQIIPAGDVGGLFENYERIWHW